MAEMALHDHTPHYHASIALTPEDTIHLENYRGKSGFFLKKMIINDKMNLNRWKVTWDAIKQDVWGFIGKPVVLTPDKDHPPVSEQEDYRVGNIIDIQLDEVNKIAYQISEIFDEKAQKMILDGKVKFGSPTVLIYSEATREQKFKGTEYQEDILHRFRPAHDALVEDPAYGKHVDYIPAVCTGDGVGCGLKLLTVSASVEYRKRYEGKAKRFSKPDSYFEDPDIQKQLAIGIIVEMEHTDDKQVARQIAMDHLAEYPDYYDRLRKVISDIPKSAEVNSNNTDQLTIVPFVKERLNKRFSAEELANIVGNIMKTRQADGDSCVSKHIRHQMDSHPSMDHDQAIAIAYSECGEGGEVEDKMEAVFMSKLASDLMKYYKD